MSARLALLASWLVLCLGACRQETSKSASDAPGATAEYTDVVAQRIAVLEAECGPLACYGGTAPASDEVAAVLGDVRELCAVVADQSDLSELALADIVVFGARGESAVAALVRDPNEEIPIRYAAAAALGRFDSAWGAETLLAVLELAETPALVRTHCAYALESGSQDWCVPQLVRRLRYETNREAWLFTARACARFENLAGLDGLFDIAASESEEERWRNEAAALCRQLATERDFEQPELLAWHWQNGNLDGRLPPEVSSARQRLEIWRCVADLGDFQLRPVDDARYVLARLGVVAAHALAEALVDSSPHVRLHAAQTLARMGPRGSVAGSALIAALDDPTAGVEAAHALGKIGVPAAEAALAERLLPSTDLALRVAAANALGWIGLPASAPLLEPLLAPEEPVDLRAAAAAGLLRTRHPAEARTAVELLLELFEDRRLDPARPEAELGTWLERTSRGDSALAPRARELFEAWNELDTRTSSGPQDREREAQRRAARRALLSAALDELPWT